MLDLSSTREHQVPVEADHSAICKFPKTGGAYQGVSDRIVALIQRIFDLRNVTSHEVNSAQSDTDQPTVPASTPNAENSSDQVLLHPSFMGWLGQFAEQPGESSETVPVSTPNICGAELETSTPPVVLTQKKTTKEVSASVATPLATPVVAMESDVGGSTQPRPSPVHNTRDTDDRLSLPIFKGDTAIVLLISGLRKQTNLDSNRTFTARVQLGLKTRVDELMLALEAKGEKLGPT